MPKKETSISNFAKLFHKFVDVAPIALPASLAAFGTIAIALLVTDKLHNILVWPLGLLVAVLAWVVVARHYGSAEKPGTDRERKIANILVIIGVIAWVGFNAQQTAQHLITERDPGVYTATSLWIAERSNLNLEKSTAFDNVPGVRPQSGGFAPNPDNQEHINAQGAHLLPTFLGLFGRIVGTRYMLHMNVLFGATALLAVYSFARLVVKPGWAVIAPLTLSLTLPMLYFSRDTYTEPLLATFTFGAFALLWLAQKTQKKSVWFLAGLVAGAGALVRIDAYMPIAGFLAFIVIYLALARKGSRRTATAQAFVYMGALAITSFLGWFDVSHLSTRYYRNEWPAHIKPEIMLIAAIIGAGAVVVLLSWQTRILPFLDEKTRKWRAPVFSSVLILGMLVIASRPLWYISWATRKIVDAKTGKYIMSEPFRAHIEATFSQVIWYLGPVMAVMGVAGLAIVGYRAMKRKDLLLVAPLIVIGATAFFYLIRPAIFPDQIWASRRFLPIVFPGFVVFGVIALEKLHSMRSLPILKDQTKTAAIVLATLAVVGPLFISWLFLGTRESTWYAPLTASCKATQNDGAVLWVGSAGTQLIESTKALCDVPAQGYGRLFEIDPPSRDTLKQAAANARKNGYRPLIGVYGSEADRVLAGQRDNLTTMTTFNYEMMERPFGRPPVRMDVVTESILVGEIQNDGSVKPISSN